MPRGSEKRFEGREHFVRDVAADVPKGLNNGLPTSGSSLVESYAEQRTHVHVHLWIRSVESQSEARDLCAVFKHADDDLGRR